jgi:hypothetical protein
VGLNVSTYVKLYKKKVISDLYWDDLDGIVSMDWSKSLCTSTGVMRFTLGGNYLGAGYSYLYNLIKLEGAGIFYVHSYVTEPTKNTITFYCQDASIFLQNYFISESYITEAPTYSGYWIKKFLTEAGVAYVMETNDNGSLVSNNTSLGMCSAMDAIMPLLQQNGWYMYFDETNVAHVGVLKNPSIAPSSEWGGNTIVELNYLTHDRMFRNRAVVWGTGDTKTGGYVFANVDRTGNYPNETWKQDQRTVVISNSNIKSASEASKIANRALDEFEKLNYEATVETVDGITDNLGQMVLVSIPEKGISIKQMVTTVGQSMSNTGYVGQMVLGERCPRLFAYYNFNGYVYVGTAGSGIWRKPLQYWHTWENFSTGLTDLNIVDLAIQDDTFAAVSQDGTLFTRFPGDSAWQPFYPYLSDDYAVPGAGDLYPVTSGRAVACDTDKINGHVIAAYTLAGTSPARSWIYDIARSGVYTKTQFVDTDGSADYTVVDVGSTGSTLVVSAVENVSGMVVLWNGHSLDTSPNYYTYNNTLSGLATGFSGLWQYDDPGITNDGYPAFYRRAVYGDGKYIYPGIESDTSNSSVIGIYTGSGEKITGGLAKNSEIQSMVPVGNKTIATVYWDDAANKNIFYSYNADLNKETTVELGTQESFIGAIAVSISGLPDFYALAMSELGEHLSMYKWSVETDNVHSIDSAYPPSTILNGTFDSLSWNPAAALAFTEGYIVGYVDVWYMNAYIGGEYVGMISIPGIVFYNTDTGSLVIRVIESCIDASNTHASLIALGASGGNAYVTVYGANYEQRVYKVSPGGSFSLTYWGGDMDIGFIANNDSIFTVEDANGILNIVNCETGGVSKRLFRDYQDVLFARQISAEGNALMYDKTDGNVYSFAVTSGVSVSGTTASGLGEFTLDTNLHPYEDLGYQFSNDDSICALVFDALYLNLVSYKDYPVIGRKQKSKEAIYIPASGRDMPVDYTRYVHDEAAVFQMAMSGVFIQAFDTIHPYNIEVSLRSPVTVYNTITYSGIVFSGTQTGVNQGELYVSPAGSPRTYSEILLNSLHSSITDVRTYKTLYSGEDGEYYGRFVLLPQISTQFVGPDTYTELVQVDVTELTGGTGIVFASGTLVGGGTSVIATFPGYANHIETTNNLDYPYMFVNVITDSGRFYQKDGYSSGESETIFEDRTNNLPNAPITIIRCDDAL